MRASAPGDLQRQNDKNGSEMPVIAVVEIHHQRSKTTTQKSLFPAILAVFLLKTKDLPDPATLACNLH